MDTFTQAVEGGVNDHCSVAAVEQNRWLVLARAGDDLADLGCQPQRLGPTAAATRAAPGILISTPEVASRVHQSCIDNLCIWLMALVILPSGNWIGRRRRWILRRKAQSQPQEIMNSLSLGDTMLRLKRFFVNTKGINIFCRDTASSGPTILCLHGLYGRGETWRDFMLRYQDKYRIVAPDQRGHGLSDKPIERYAPQDFAADANDLIQQLECGPAIVVGHSMGGRVAGFLAALFPQSVKAVAILDVGAYGPDNLSNLRPHQIPQVDELTSNWPTPYPTYEDAVQQEVSNSDHMVHVDNPEEFYKVFDRFLETIC
jgi:pimeloyl-ACP methyl ester carboxylesterase